MTTRGSSITRLFLAFRQQADEVLLSIYRDGTAHVNDRALAGGVDKVIMECEFMPSVATLLQACRDATPRDAVPALLAHDGPTVWCEPCQDTGWVWTTVAHPAGYIVEAVGPRCHCHATNPRIQRGGYAG